MHQYEAPTHTCIYNVYKAVEIRNTAVYTYIIYSIKHISIQHKAHQYTV